MPPEPMMAVRGLVIRTLTRHQFTRLPQDREQAISPHLQRCFSFDMQQMVQLARSQPGLATALFQDKIQNVLIVFGACLVCPNTFVISLARNPYEQASPGNTQAFDLPLREDLPDRFFTMETP